ncbi:MAG: FtsK/SpoIIIE domain-containing protein, partial [Streptosporangiaceae bacterium]
MPMPWPDESLGLVAAAGVARWCYRHRSAFLPFLITLTAFITAAIAHAHHALLWIAATIVTGIVTAALGIPHGWLRRRPAGRQIAVFLTLLWRSCGIDRYLERLYLAVVTGATGIWLSAAIAVGPAHKALLWVALLGTLILGIPWWAHRRRRGRVKMEKIIDAWPGMADNIGLPGSHIASAVVDTWGWTAHLALRKGTTAAEAITRIPAIESGLALPPGSARVQPDTTRADRVILRVIETSPHAQPIPWPGPVTTSITQPAELGLFEDGTPARVFLLRRNVLAGGTTGSGKSGVLNVILAILAACEDVVIWGVDLKGGMELGPWAACLERLATTPGEAITLFHDAIAELDTRAGALAARGLRVWEPSRAYPALVIVADEYAELPAPAQDCADSIARRGRAPAVSLLAATQRPTQEAMGNNAVRSQMDVRICLRVKERRDADLILGQGSFAAGWHPHTITQPGVFLVCSPEHTTPDRALAYLLDDGQVTRHARQHAHHRPHLAPDPPRSTQAPQQPTPGSGTPPGPDTALWDALSDAGVAGVSVPELARLTGRSRRWVYYRLTGLASAGRAAQTARGRW